MEKYLRFQTSMRCPDTGKYVGIFVASGWLKEDGRLEADDTERLNVGLRWFNENLTVPSVHGKRRRAVFWFRTEAQEMIAHVWGIVEVLQQAGLSVERHMTSRPGAIVYSDELQIAAIADRKPRQRRVRVL